MKVYGFYYCDCIYESAFALHSLHYSLKGAYRAMKEHRIKTFNDWRALPNQFRKPFLDTFPKSWRVRSIEIEY